MRLRTHVGTILGLHGVFTISIERKIEEARRWVEVDEVATLLHQLTLLSFGSENV